MKWYKSMSIGLVKFGPCFNKFFGNLKLILETYALSFYWSKSDFNQDLVKYLVLKYNAEYIQTYLVTSTYLPYTYRVTQGKVWWSSKPIFELVLTSLEIVYGFQHVPKVITFDLWPLDLVKIQISKTYPKLTILCCQM